ncbi:hypothetical protein ABZ446_02075 [Streptomyces sp. NPDC005813]
MEQARQEYVQVSGTEVTSVPETYCFQLVQAVGVARVRALRRRSSSPVC